MNFEKRMAEIEERLTTIANEIEADDISAEEIEKLGVEVDELQGEREEILSKQEILKRGKFTPYKPNVSHRMVNSKDARGEKLEELGKELRQMFMPEKKGYSSGSGERSVNITLEDMDILAESMGKRAIGIDTSGVVLTQLFDLNIEQPLPQYSNSADMVQVKDGGKNQSYTKTFIKTVTAADYKDDNEEYAEAEPTIGYVNIPAGKITAKLVVEEALVKLTNIDYASEIMRLAGVALKMKIASQLVLGDGSSIDGTSGILKKFTGIYNSTGDVAPTTVEADSLTVDVIRDLMLNYGNDEVTGGFGQVLMLNKADLTTLMKLKDTSGRYYYNWTPDPATNGNTGTLTLGEIGKGVKNEITTHYVVNSACQAHGTASADDKTIIYGNIFDYCMPVFAGGIEIRRKREDNGNYTTFADLYAGGNVGGYKKFVILKKPAA